MQPAGAEAVPMVTDQDVPDDPATVMQYLMQILDFNLVLRDDQELSANGMSATGSHVDAVLVYFNLKKTDLNFSTNSEEVAETER